MPLHPVPRARLLLTAAHARLHRNSRDDRGQSTTEYGLVILVAGTIALGVIAWAGRTSAFTDLFDTVIDRLLDE